MIHTYLVLVLLGSFGAALPALAGNLPGKPAAPRPPAAPRGLLISGTIHGGRGSLEPAFQTAGISSQPEPGPFALKFLDGQGQLLKEVTFDAPEDPMVPDFRSFTFVLPFPAALEASLVTLDLYEGAAKLATLEGSSHLARVALLQRGPLARRLRPGAVRLTWDPVRHPKIMVKDSATGAPIAVAVGGVIDLATEAGQLEVTLSDGLRSLTRRVTVVD